MKTPDEENLFWRSNWLAKMDTFIEFGRVFLLKQILSSDMHTLKSLSRAKSTSEAFEVKDTKWHLSTCKNGSRENRNGSFSILSSTKISFCRGKTCIKYVSGFRIYSGGNRRP